MLRITKLADAEYLLRQVALGIDDHYVGAGRRRGVAGPPGGRVGPLRGGRQSHRHPPEQVAEKIARYVELGCTYFVPWSPDYPSLETLTLFTERVIPEFR